MKEAMFYELIDKEKGIIKCLLCPKECLIKKGQVGFCRSRKNINNKLHSLIYSKVSSCGFDPIEKKPLYHFYPGTSVLSLGTVGCSFTCSFCQNWTISQGSIENVSVEELSPERAVQLTIDNNSPGIAYTYSEPLIWYEYVLDTARLAKKNNLKNILVTNGFINREPLIKLLPFIDAMNIDLKSFRNSFYKKYSQGSLSPVLRTIELSKEYCHIEITNLIIPGLNDSEEEIKEMVDWISSLSEDIPLHFSRYFPCYKMDISATPISTLYKARDIAQKKLKYVYIGNIRDEETNTTYCGNCKKTLIKRTGYNIINLCLGKDGRCKFCGEKVVYSANG
ncbi:AmmeMemoRadiSam system radical SAM enzyme [Candidatus Atribacteria bacterium MT.SAG.1]|nr:AmmeMemoRadiSam system radical SAM enzyme [Candidatus Atribacteria bacterium MT.SAG.1]